MNEGLRALLCVAFVLSCKHPDAESATDSIAHSATSKAARAESSSLHQPRSAEKSNPPNEVDSIGPFHDSITVGSRRFGIVDFGAEGAPCVALEGEPPATGTHVLLVSDPRAPQHIGAAVTTRPLEGDCGPSSAMLGRAYELRVTAGKAARGFGIIGPVDTLRVDHHRAVVVFPGDTAHWHFGTCTSAEGVHYVIDRVSADSVLELWDGYYHVDYDLEPTCRNPRDLARAIDARTRVKAWNAGTRAHDVAMSLVVARWIRCVHAGGPLADADSAVTDSTAYPAALPPMDELVRALGMPNDGGPEDAFILGWLGREQLDCFEGALPQSPDSLVVSAARRDSSSALFRYFGEGKKSRPATDALAEARRRFTGRGEHYRAILDWLREELPGS